MRYTSTRAQTDVAFEEVVASGLAAGGGLYLPQQWPRLSPEALDEIAADDYPDAVARIGAMFSGESVPADVWRAIARDAFSAFRHPAIVPLFEIGRRHWLLELFHGPTLSFKDYGLQPLGRLLERIAVRDGRPLFILGATSGDTGSAGIAAFRGREKARIVILHPEGRVSEIQRRQMTTETAENVLNIAVDGSFDDCQRIVKALLAERAAAGREAVLSVNSINWGRLLFQCAYYVYISTRLARFGRRVAFAIPSGNFGNAFSAIVASRIGAPIHRLLVATNSNDALAQALTAGNTAAGRVQATLSPAMDIQIPSNLERLVYLGTGEDAGGTSSIMQTLAETGRLTLPTDWKAHLPLGIDAERVTDEEVIETIGRIHRETDRIVDPHTAVALAAAARTAELSDMDLITVSTAHPAKFSDAVREALGFAPPSPATLADLFDREERFIHCAATLESVRTAIDGRA